ncbi:hypothetical protein [Ulvibacterium marinum]|nr:hypothetical protein [Ulvibacterium marinum]
MKKSLSAESGKGKIALFSITELIFLKKKTEFQTVKDLLIAHASFIA